MDKYESAEKEEAKNAKGGNRTKDQGRKKLHFDDEEESDDKQKEEQKR